MRLTLSELKKKISKMIPDDVEIEAHDVALCFARCDPIDGSVSDPR